MSATERPPAAEAQSLGRYLRSGRSWALGTVLLLTPSAPLHPPGQPGQAAPQAPLALVDVTLIDEVDPDPLPHMLPPSPPGKTPAREPSAAWPWRSRGA